MAAVKLRQQTNDTLNKSMNSATTDSSKAGLQSAAAIEILPEDLAGEDDSPTNMVNYAAEVDDDLD